MLLVENNGGQQASSWDRLFRLIRLRAATGCEATAGLTRRPALTDDLSTQAGLQQRQPCLE